MEELIIKSKELVQLWTYFPCGDCSQCELHKIEENNIDLCSLISSINDLLRIKELS